MLYTTLANDLDAQWQIWLQANYSRLSGNAVPRPHHLFHVPRWLQFQVEKDQRLRPALFVMDGMSLADWRQIASVWQERHSDWNITEDLLMAQIPSITSISRQALVSGTRPANFANTLLTTHREPQAWRDTWREAGLNARFEAKNIVYAALTATPGSSYPPAIDEARTRALCLVCVVIDDILHGSVVGATGMEAAIDVWLQADEQHAPRSAWVERLIHLLLTNGYTIYMTSDHGHVEAVGMGQPQQGVLVAARNKRARIYTERAHAEAARKSFPSTILWAEDNVLPAGHWVLMPSGREAFAPAGETVVSHGGISLDEMIVPFITIRKQ